MIEIKDLTYAYEKGRPVLQNIHLTLRAGGVYGLLGLNGVGKTTLLHLIGGGLRTRAGTVTTFGENPGERPVSLLSNLFLMTADLYLPKCTLAEYAALYQPFYPSFDAEKWQHALSLMRLSPAMALHKISFGQRKKAVFCFAFATQCRLLLLDEPTDGLDSPSKVQFRRLLSEYVQDDRLVLIATHHVHDVAPLLDHLIMLDEGSVILNTPIETLSEQYSIRKAAQLPESNGILYSERTPGGYRYLIQHQPDGHSEELDLEFLFNAILYLKDNSDNS